MEHNRVRQTDGCRRGAWPRHESRKMGDRLSHQGPSTAQRPLWRSTSFLPLEDISNKSSGFLNLFLLLQVGDGNTDHYCWQRPEDMTTPRKAYRVDVNNPGSDLAGETAAAMAAAAIIFRRSDPAYSNKLIRHAQQVPTISILNFFSSCVTWEGFSEISFFWCKFSGGC